MGRAVPMFLGMNKVVEFLINHGMERGLTKNRLQAVYTPNDYFYLKNGDWVPIYWSHKLLSDKQYFETSSFFPMIIELDDGKILSGKPDQFDGKKPWVSGEDFPNKTNPLVIPFINHH